MKSKDFKRYFYSNEDKRLEAKSRLNGETALSVEWLSHGHRYGPDECWNSKTKARHTTNNCSMNSREKQTHITFEEFCRFFHPLIRKAISKFRQTKTREIAMHRACHPIDQFRRDSFFRLAEFSFKRTSTMLPSKYRPLLEQERIVGR